MEAISKHDEALYAEMMRQARARQEKLRTDPTIDAINNWSLKNAKKTQPARTIKDTAAWLEGMIQNFDD